MQEFGKAPTPLPSAPPLDQAQPNGNYVRDALYLAVRESQVGQPVKARAQIKAALFQLDQIGDPSARAYWQGQVDLTTAYVEANAGAAEALDKQAQLSDASYVNGQKLSPAVQQELVADNADTQAALDAQASGGNPTLAYNQRKILAIPAAGSAALAGVVGGVLSPWKWALAVGALVVAVVAGGYGYVYYRAAKGVTS